MVLPITHSSALILLLLSSVCFGIWPNLYKIAAPRWRFELFSVDFGFGALLFALLAAYTLGTFGPEMSFSDRMLIAGKTAEVWVAAAGIVFVSGNMLFLAAVRLVGLAAASLSSFSTALILTSLLHAGSLRPVMLALAILLAVGAIVCAQRAARSASASKPLSANTPRPPGSAALKGAILSVAAGLLFGLFQFPLQFTADPEFGPGPYASILMFAIGVLVATPVLNFFFMNIKITGDPINYGLYRHGSARQHALGIAGGVVWAIGALGVFLALSVPGEQGPGSSMALLLPALTVLAYVCCGYAVWKEISTSAGALSLALGALCFTASLALICWQLSVPPA